MLEHHHALELSPLHLPVPEVGGSPEETHEIVTGTTRAHTSSPRTRRGTPITRTSSTCWTRAELGFPFAWVDLTSTAQDRFATVTHDPHVSLLTGDAETTGGTR